MTHKEAKKIYKLLIETGRPVDEIIEEVYYDKGEEVVKQKLLDFMRILDELKSNNIRNPKEVIAYLDAPRDEVDIINRDEEGNIINATHIEGDPKFDPSGKTDLTPLTGSSDFEFGDSSIKKEEKHPWDDLPPLPDFELSFNGIVTGNNKVNDDFVFNDDDEKEDRLIIVDGKPKEIDYPDSRVQIKPDMTPMEMIEVMAQGNRGALNVLTQMMGDEKRFKDILLCDSLNIRGSKLYMLHNDCCSRRMTKFDRTLNLFRFGIFSEEEIQKNLGLDYAIPFIDDSIIVDGVPPYGEDFGPSNPKWNEYCSKNREVFINKLNNALGDKGLGSK